MIKLATKNDLEGVSKLRDYVHSFMQIIIQSFLKK